MTLEELELETRLGASTDARGAAPFVRRFARFWAAPSPEAVPVYLRPGVVIHWPGVPAFSGAEYPAFVRRILAAMPDLRLTVTESAAGEDFVFIGWNACATVAGKPHSWRGIDRFRLHDGEAVEAFVAYDSLALQTALAGATADATSANAASAGVERAQTRTALDRYADAKNRHDLDAIVAAYADDGYYESVGLGGRVQGKHALRQFYASFLDALPDYHARFDDVAVGEGCAVVRGRFGGTLSGRFMGQRVEPGLKVDVPVVFVCTFRDGLIVSETGYFDAATLCAQARLPLGALHGAPGFVERFRSFWAAPSGAKTRDLVAPDAVVHWPGVAAMSGETYPAHMDAILALVPGMKLDVVDYALADDLLFVFWRANAVVGDRSLSWTGVDRFRLRNDRAIEEVITFDTQPLREALAAPRRAPARVPDAPA